MKIPGAEGAVVPIKKLRDYCLNPEHPRGRNKARRFREVFGLDATGAEVLRDALKRAVTEKEAVPAHSDYYGRRYQIDFSFDYESREGNIRSCWIIRRNESVPRLTTCYVL